MLRLLKRLWDWTGDAPKEKLRAAGYPGHVPPRPMPPPAPPPAHPDAPWFHTVASEIHGYAPQPPFDDDELETAPVVSEAGRADHDRLELIEWDRKEVAAELELEAGLGLGGVHV